MWDLIVSVPDHCLSFYFDDNSIKNERASMETPFSHYKPMGNCLDAQGQLTS